jgi:hypothetical protein
VADGNGSIGDVALSVAATTLEEVLQSRRNNEQVKNEAGLEVV